MYTQHHFQWRFFKGNQIRDEGKQVVWCKSDLKEDGMLLPYIENNSHFNRDRSRKDCDNLSYFLSIFFFSPPISS